MVFASRPVVSARRLAARPVGAASRMRRALLLQDADDPVDERGLARARSAGDDQELARRRLADGLLLLVGAARLRIGEQALRSGDDGHAETAAHTRNFSRADVLAQTGLADTLEALDDAFLALVFEVNLDLFLRGTFHRHFGNIALALEDFGNALLDSGVRQDNHGQQRASAIADACQHVRNRIAHIKITSWIW